MSVSVALSCQTPACRETTDTGLVHCVVCLFMPRLLSVGTKLYCVPAGARVQTTCPELVHSHGLAGARTRDLLTVSLTPYHYATTSPTLYVSQYTVQFLDFTAQPHSKKVKFSHTRYRALGPELIPVYRQSARRWRELNHAIYLAVVCHCFLPGLRLPS